MTSCSGLPPTCPRKWWIVWSPIRAAVPRFRNCSRTLSCRFTEAPEQRKPAVSDDRRAFFDSGGRLAGFANQVAGMQAAFLVGGFFPPPAAFALVLAWQYRAGAGLATDADKALFVQAVVGGFRHADVVPDLFRAPVRQWVELHQRFIIGRERRIDLHHRHLVPGARALVPALAGNPGIHRGQFLAQWVHLADAAAFRMAVFVEAEQAFLAHQGLNFPGVRKQH